MCIGYKRVIWDLSNCINQLKPLSVISLSCVQCIMETLKCVKFNFFWFICLWVRKKVTFNNIPFVCNKSIQIISGLKSNGLNYNYIKIYPVPIFRIIDWNLILPNRLNSATPLTSPHQNLSTLFLTLPTPTKPPFGSQKVIENYVSDLFLSALFSI
jgi:hypothetical protein